MIGYTYRLLHRLQLPKTDGKAPQHRALPYHCQSRPVQVGSSKFNPCALPLSESQLHKDYSFHELRLSFIHHPVFSP